jgi:signal transduction histidine kinase
LATSRLPTYIPDLTALENDHRDDFLIAVVEAGFRSSLVVPLLKDDAVFGVIALGRKQMQPFADKQISLFTDFAAQADIALETTRRERQYREMQSDLTHANRVATMGQLTASIAHEIKQPIATARNNPRAALNFLDKSPPDAAEVREALACIVNDIDRNNEVVDRIGCLIKKSATQKGGHRPQRGNLGGDRSESGRSGQERRHDGHATCGRLATHNAIGCSYNK